MQKNMQKNAQKNLQNTRKILPWILMQKKLSSNAHKREKAMLRNIPTRIIAFSEAKGICVVKC